MIIDMAPPARGAAPDAVGSHRRFNSCPGDSWDTSQGGGEKT